MGAAGAGILALAGTALGSRTFRLGGVEADGLYIEAFPTSPLILNPFSDPLPIPKALAPVPKSVWGTWKNPPGPGAGQQDSLGKGMHQVWTSDLGLPDPIVYQIKLEVSSHRLTTSRVLPIGIDGKPVTSFDEQGNRYAPGTVRTLPESCIYGFNGGFPGARVNAEYGKPCILRFENHLDENPHNYGRGDFGSPEWAFLTHLHNAHTAPESDGNPHYAMRALGQHGYLPGQWVDNLYLNYPAGGDDREKQSFFWFHDHTMDHTGANVYKGMVGLYPIYDPKDGMDMGDERQGLRLPGVRTNNPDGSFDVEYDIPLAFYDCRLDDGLTPHKDFHSGTGETHPEWWGDIFFKHFPNHGFVGDIFTVNGMAYPVLEVKRRKYRFRFLDASISRIYEFKLMSSTQGPKTAVSLGYDGVELQGQYRLPDGQQCMRFVQIATDGGLLPTPILRDSFDLWPAKRREFIVDCTRYLDGSPTTKGDVIYLVNTMKMTDGREPSGFDPNYKVPVLKIVIGDDAPDNSQIPLAMRALPPLPSPTQLQKLIDNRRVFEVQRGGFGGEIEWLINSRPFDPYRPLASVRRGIPEVWEIKNGGGGWVHPLHLHMEEHQVISRNGSGIVGISSIAEFGRKGVRRAVARNERRSPSAPIFADDRSLSSATGTLDLRRPDDISREDVVALEPGESVLVCRNFRTFTGPYVAHCHNLAHEDHAMMFGWEILP